MKESRINIFHSFLIAFSVLTRLPIPFSNKLNFSRKNFSFSFIFFPIVGLFYGSIIFLAAKLLLFIKLPIQIISLIILLIPFILNKFFHFDGLCDVLDSFLADKSKEDRLIILKDSKTGSFALGGAVIFVLSKYVFINLFLESNSYINFLILMPVFSRFSMILMSFKSKYPRQKGTALMFVGNVPGLVLFFSSILFVMINMIFIFSNINNYLYYSLILGSALIFIILFILFFRLYSLKKIGGITGDVLGACCEIIELLLLIYIILFLHFVKL